MTRDELTALSGPELDAQIASRVMGWAVTRDARGAPYSYGSGHDAVYAEAFQPSADIAAAWKAVDALSARGYALTLEDWRGVVGEGAQWAALFTFPDGHDTGHLVASEAARAVCLAALACLPSLAPA